MEKKPTTTQTRGKRWVWKSDQEFNRIRLKKKNAALCILSAYTVGYQFFFDIHKCTVVIVIYFFNTLLLHILRFTYFIFLHLLHPSSLSCMHLANILCFMHFLLSDITILLLKSFLFRHAWQLSEIPKTSPGTDALTLSESHFHQQHQGTMCAFMSQTKVDTGLV